MFEKKVIYLQSVSGHGTGNMVVVAQLVRASVCGTEGRGFEPHPPPEGAVAVAAAPFPYVIVIAFYAFLPLFCILNHRNAKIKIRRVHNGR